MNVIFRIAASFLALVGAPLETAEAAFPEKLVRLVVGFPPGSQPDVVARLFAVEFARSLGQPFVVDNASGAAGNIAVDRVAKSAPDGYTLGLVGQGPLVINSNFYTLTFDPSKDLVPISQAYYSPTMLVVHTSNAARTIAQLVAMAKAQPGSLTYASGGNGGASHIATELFKAAAGLDIRHISYKGTVAAIPDLMGGRLTMMLSPTADVLPLVREGKLRALAVTSLRRSSVAIDVPTVSESGYPGFEFAVWQGFVAPAGTPREVVRRLHMEVVAALARADLRAKLSDFALEGIGNSPAEFASVIAAQIPMWGKVIKQLGIKAD